MGKFLRPKAEVLPDSAMVPEENLTSPPPTHFTHELNRAAPYFYTSAQSGVSPDGEFPAGTKVLLVSTGGDYCRVVDERGLRVDVECAALTKL